MLKVMAVLRTLFLAFVVFYLVQSLPLALLLSSDARQGNVTVNLDVIKAVATAAWLPVGWIALETVIGWVRVWMAARQAAKAAAPAAPRPAAP